MPPRRGQPGAKVSGVSYSGEEYPHQELTEKIIGCGIRMHRELGPGYLEMIYENAMAHELTKQGLRFQRQFEAPVYYDSVQVGLHRADVLVEGQVVIELKSVDTLSDKHVAQVISTLKATKATVGLLLNFNEARLVDGIRRVVLSQNP